MALWILLAVHFVAAVATASSPLIDTKYGQLEGFTTKLLDGSEAAVFLGVPYAQPPVGELRLEKPDTILPWDGVRKATTFGKSCFPYHPKHLLWEHSEDCLYLNVITPLSVTTPGSELYPVAFFVHGGGYNYGSSTLHQYQFLAEKYASQGIVVVTINYRLGPLGFMAAGSSLFGGNYGLWDQTEALRFVSENIAAFGGDPKRITVWGYSAGSSSVGALTLSTHSRDFFQQAIEMSGSYYSERTTSDRVIVETKVLASLMDCEAEDAKELKKCLKTKTPKEFKEAATKGVPRWDYNINKFSTRIDGDFFVKDYPELIRDAPKKPTLIGISDSEALLFTALERKSPTHNISIPLDERKFSEADIRKFVTEVLVPEKTFGEKTEEAREKVYHFYLSEHDEEEKDYRYYVKKYTQLISDVNFIVPTLYEVYEKALAGWPLHLYLVEYYNAEKYPKSVPVKGALHVIEFPYIFGIPQPWDIGEFNEDDKKFQKTMLDAIISFIKTGKPTLDDVEWPAADRTHPLRYAGLKPSPDVGKALFSERYKFWHEFEKWSGVDILRGTHRSPLKKSVKEEL